MPTTSQVSDETLAAAPPYIVVGEAWDDPEWRAAAAKPPAERTEQEKYLFMGGPRPNPWGFSVFQGQLPDGRFAYFPSRAAYDAFLGGQTQQSAQPALEALNRGLSAQARVEAQNEAGRAESSAGQTQDGPATGSKTNLDTSQPPVWPDSPLPGA